MTLLSWDISFIVRIMGCRSRSPNAINHRGTWQPPAAQTSGVHPAAGRQWKNDGAILRFALSTDPYRTRRKTAWRSLRRVLWESSRWQHIFHGGGLLELGYGQLTKFVQGFSYGVPKSTVYDTEYESSRGAVVRVPKPVPEGPRLCRAAVDLSQPLNPSSQPAHLTQAIRPCAGLRSRQHGRPGARLPASCPARGGR